MRTATTYGAASAVHSAGLRARRAEGDGFPREDREEDPRAAGNTGAKERCSREESGQAEEDRQSNGRQRRPRSIGGLEAHLLDDDAEGSVATVEGRSAQGQSQLAAGAEYVGRQRDVVVPEDRIQAEERHLPLVDEDVHGGGGASAGRLPGAARTTSLRPACQGAPGSTTVDSSLDQRKGNPWVSSRPQKPSTNGASARLPTRRTIRLGTWYATTSTATKLPATAPSRDPVVMSTAILAERIVGLPWSLRRHGPNGRVNCAHRRSDDILGPFACRLANSKRRAMTTPLTQARIRDGALESIREKVLTGKRLSFEDGVALYRSHDLLALGALANHVREQRHGDAAYFVWNTHLNHTNVCVATCDFCAFAAKKDEPRAYAMKLDEVFETVSKLPKAVREVHIVGGLHPDLPWSYFVDMMAGIKRVRPDIHVKAFTAVEIFFFHKLYRMSGRPGARRAEGRGAGLDARGRRRDLRERRPGTRSSRGRPTRSSGST